MKIELKIDLSDDVNNLKIRKKGESLLKKLTNYTVIDLETTGVNVKECEIIEMSALRIRDNKIVEEYSQLIKPSYGIPTEIEKLTGITNEMVADMPSIDKVIQNFLDFIGDDIVVGHNIASFDTSIIYDVTNDLLGIEFNNDMIDTMRFAKYCNIEVDDYKLSTLTAYYSIENETAHRALSDCKATFYLYQKLEKDFDGEYHVKTNSESEENEIIQEPTLNLKDKKVCVTGEFKIGKRQQVLDFLERHGAVISKGVNSKLDYLIVGELGSKYYKPESHGNKFESVRKLQDKGNPIKIITESDLFNPDIKNVEQIETKSSQEETDLYKKYNDIVKNLNVEYGIDSDDKNLLLTCVKIKNGYSFRIGGSYAPLIIESNKSTTRLFIKTTVFQKIAVDFGKHKVHIIKAKPDYTTIDFAIGEDISKFILPFLKYALEVYKPDKTFACCSRYVECSDAKKCLHPNPIYSKQCWYRDNLENNKIFYGKNKNI